MSLITCHCIWKFRGLSLVATFPFSPGARQKSFALTLQQVLTDQIQSFPYCLTRHDRLQTKWRCKRNLLNFPQTFLGTRQTFQFSFESLWIRHIHTQLRRHNQTQNRQGQNTHLFLQTLNDRVGPPANPCWHLSDDNLTNSDPQHFFYHRQ